MRAHRGWLSVSESSIFTCCSPLPYTRRGSGTASANRVISSRTMRKHGAIKNRPNSAEIGWGCPTARPPRVLDRRAGSVFQATTAEFIAFQEVPVFRLPDPDYDTYAGLPGPLHSA